VAIDKNQSTFGAISLGAYIDNLVQRFRALDDHVVLSALVNVRSAPALSPFTAQSTTLARYWHAALKSLINFQTASAGARIVIMLMV
jgi:hypothetical protein